MKKLIPLFVFLLYSLVCKSQSTIPLIDIEDLEKLKFAKIDKKYLKAVSLKSMILKYDSIQIALKKLNKTVNREKDYYFDMSKDDYGYYSFYEKVNESEAVQYHFSDFLLWEIRVIKAFRLKYEEIDTVFEIDNYYAIDKNGNLKFSRCELNGGVFDEIKIDEVRKYNKKGKVIKKINYDKHFKYTLQDILKIGSENFQMNINVEMYMSRSFNEKEAYWIIMYRLPNDNSDPAFSKIIIINDKTKEIKDVHYRDAQEYKFEGYQEKLLEDFYK